VLLHKHPETSQVLFTACCEELCDSVTCGKASTVSSARNNLAHIKRYVFEKRHGDVLKKLRDYSECGHHDSGCCSGGCRADESAGENKSGGNTSRSSAPSADTSESNGVAQGSDQSEDKDAGAARRESHTPAKKHRDHDNDGQCVAEGSPTVRDSALEHYLRVYAKQINEACQAAGAESGKDYVCMYPRTHGQEASIKETDIEMGNIGAPQAAQDDDLLLHVHTVECLPAYLRDAWRGDRHRAMLTMMLHIGQVCVMCVCVCLNFCRPKQKGCFHLCCLLGACFLCVCVCVCVCIHEDTTYAHMLIFERA
jgi:hypothetical protein